jgi:hypothetical protein
MLVKCNSYSAAPPTLLLSPTINLALVAYSFLALAL